MPPFIGHIDNIIYNGRYNVNSANCFYGIFHVSLGKIYIRQEIHQNNHDEPTPTFNQIFETIVQHENCR